MTREKLDILKSYRNTKNPEEKVTKLEREWLDDITNELPKRKYVGNCTKEFCGKLVELYAAEEWARIQFIDFPDAREHPITEKQAEHDIRTLCQTTLNREIESLAILKFHKSMIYANIDGYKSPYDGWLEIKKDRDKFLDFYRNILIYSDWYKENDNWHYLLIGYVPDFIYGCALSASHKFPLVTYFKPHLAKYLIEKYLKPDGLGTIIDPFSGYSGRMLGALTTGMNYFGIDLCKSSVNESRELLRFAIPIIKKELGYVPNCQLNYDDCTYYYGKYKYLLTCPPYGNIEQWPGVPAIGKTCDEWIDMCLKNFKCDKYVFVVDNKINKYKKYIAEELVNTFYFGHNSEYIIVIKSNKNV